jgi:hypothetical protein
VSQVLEYTEAQAGGRKTRSTIDQLFILKSIIFQQDYHKKQTFLALIDLEQAYDKTWRASTLYTLWKRKI